MLWSDPIGPNIDDEELEGAKRETITYDANWDSRAVAAIITTIVPLIIFLVFQRQFAGGATSRSSPTPSVCSA